LQQERNTSFVPGKISKVTAVATDKFETQLSTIPSIVNVGNTEGNTDPNTALTQELGRVV
jgi:hypothetical protein